MDVGLQYHHPCDHLLVHGPRIQQIIIPSQVIYRSGSQITSWGRLYSSANNLTGLVVSEDYLLSSPPPSGEIHPKSSSL